jgi:hypothetical protein
MTVQGAVNAEVFRCYVREILLPTIKAEARANEVLLLAIEDSLSEVTPKDATHWFTH